MVRSVIFPIHRRLEMLFPWNCFTSIKICAGSIINEWCISTEPNYKTEALPGGIRLVIPPEVPIYKFPLCRGYLIRQIWDSCLRQSIFENLRQQGWILSIIKNVREVEESTFLRHCARAEACLRRRSLARATQIPGWKPYIFGSSKSGRQTLTIHATCLP